MAKARGARNRQASAAVAKDSAAKGEPELSSLLPKQEFQAAINLEDVPDLSAGLRRSSRLKMLGQSGTTALSSHSLPKVEDEKHGGSADEKVLEEIGEAPLQTPKKKPSPRKTKANPYGLTPGVSPFPDWPGPTADQCEEAARLLASIHGEFVVPEKIPAPSLEVTGCGEVPSILDALIRTLLSANTTANNANMAFQGLVNTFGILEEGIGKGSVNWNNVRSAPVEDIIAAIWRGGLAKTKANNIKRILNIVYEENRLRRDAYIKERETGQPAQVTGAQDKTQGQKDLEIAKTDTNVLSLDHIHGMSPDQAMLELTKFPGIGVKTSACVILFCMQQPSFAVDTHVWRLCKWLGWVPPTATRDQTFSHCEVRVPNHLKYPLHRLLIRHGRTCGRCRAITGEGSAGWAEADCPIDHLVERTGKRKTGSTPPKRGLGIVGQKRKRAYEDESEDELDLSDHDSDDLAEVSD